MSQQASQRPEKKVALVGFTTSRRMAPWGQDGWEIWICNNLWKFCPPDWHRLYDLHATREIRGDQEHEAFLRGQAQKHAETGQQVQIASRPAYVFEPQKEWPTAERFPRDEVVDALGGYFTNSISWMIAHALMEGVTELHVYGVDMATGGEYAAQRPSCEYFLGLAAGMGVKVYVPPQSDLLKVTAMYGTEGDSALHAKMRERQEELTKRAQALDQQIAQMQTQRAQVQGALEQTAYVLDVWTNPRAVSRHAEPSQNGAVDKELVAA